MLFRILSNCLEDEVMHWNLRIIKKPDPSGETGEYYGIYEVYYNSFGKPYMHTEDPVDVSGDSLEELIEYQGMLCEAWDAPILTPEDFPTGG